MTTKHHHRHNDLPADLRQETYTSNGVLRWRSSGNLVPLDVFEEARIEPPRAQAGALRRAAAKTVSQYRRQRRQRGYSDEELFEMAANFAPGTEVVDVLSGQVWHV